MSTIRDNPRVSSRNERIVENDCAARTPPDQGFPLRDLDVVVAESDPGSAILRWGLPREVIVGTQGASFTR